MSSVRTSGPLFDGRADQAATDYVRAVRKDAAEKGKDLVQANLASSLKRPTGRYQSQIHTNHGGGSSHVWDGWMLTRLVYGPWLEGVGSRNKSTRFKGYTSFRRAANKLRQLVPALGNRLLKQYYLHRMNG